MSIIQVLLIIFSVLFFTVIFSNIKYSQYLALVPCTQTGFVRFFEKRIYVRDGREEYFMNGKKLTGFMLLFLFTDIDKVEKDGYGFVSEYCDKEGETIPMSTTFLLALNLYDHKIETGLHPRDIEEIPYEYQRCFLCKKIQL